MKNKNFFIGEMSNWRKSWDFWKIVFIKKLSERFSRGVLSKDAEFFLEHKLIRLFVNFKDKYVEKVFLLATAGGDTETVRLSVEKGVSIHMSKFYALYVTALMIANHNSSEAVDAFVATILDFWDKLSEEEQGLLFDKISNWRNSRNLWKENFIDKLAGQFSKGILSTHAKHFLEHRLIRLFKIVNLENAFMAAAARGHTETAQFLIQKGLIFTMLIKMEKQL